MIRLLFRLAVRAVVTLVVVGCVLIGLYLYRTGRLPFVKQAVEEAKVTASVQAALAVHHVLGERPVRVSVGEGIVTLSGSVASEGEKHTAEDIAAAVDGVAGVENRIEIDPALADGGDGAERRSFGERIDDVALRAKIETALRLDRRTRHANVSVSVASGIVTLQGTVDSEELAKSVRERVLGVAGIAEVDDRLRVEGSGPE